MLNRLKNKLRKTPVIGKIAVFTKRFFFPVEKFETSTKYWEERYKSGGNSGAGSYNELAKFKGDIINAFVAENNIKSVIEFGCGDGNQLKYFSFNSYTGYDVSSTAVKLCSEIYKDDQSKQFISIFDYKPTNADLTMSLDVIYHLVEDDIFYDYMCKLFDSSDKYVIIYSSNGDLDEYNGLTDHVRHRKFTDWIERERPNFKMIKFIPNKYQYNGDGINTSLADFYIFEKSIFNIVQ